MRRHNLIFIPLLMLLACSSQKSDVSVTAPMADMAAGTRSVPGSERYLAYQHFIQIETSRDDVIRLSDSVQLSCRNDTANACTVMNSQINTGEIASASLTLRVQHGGVEALIAMLSAGGQVTNRSTTAEDLAGPITDNDRKLAMLSDYRSRLETLRTRAGNDVDALIKVNHELADVQSQFEALSGEQARLNQRVDTEILNISISSSRHRGFWAPVGGALAAFGGNLSQGISSFITGIAYLLPWLLIGYLLLWIWRRSRRSRTGR